jgi:hypothetical protein
MDGELQARRQRKPQMSHHRCPVGFPWTTTWKDGLMVLSGITQRRVDGAYSGNCPYGLF